jgi:putative hydrolase of the HAD superfamily
MNKPIKTLLFDFGGTLDANGVAWKERFYALYRAEGLDMAADAFASSFFAADDALVGRLAPVTDLSGTVHALVANLEAELARHAGANWADTSSGRRSSGDRAVHVASRFLAEVSANVARNRPVLSVLRERYRLGVVSNFYGNLEAVCYGVGLASLFAVLVDSHCVGAKKPDPAIFRAALEPLGAEPDSTVFVGDSLRRDREGARRAGLRFVWMVPCDVTAAEAQVLAGRPVERSVSALCDLMNLLT